MSNLLDGVQIIELAQFIAGPYCGLLFAGLGADVLKIEEPEVGDISRRCGPFPDNVPHSDHSGLFLYLNRNKRGITLNIRTATGWEILSRLLKEADVLIEDIPFKLAKNLGLDYAHLREINSRLIVASISPFGQTGPYRDYKAYAINESGIGGMSPIIGEPSREPLTPPFSLGHFQTGIITANAIMFALMAQNHFGEGQHIDVAEAESWAIFHTGNVVSSFIYSGRKRRRAGYRTPAPYPYTILPCKDGYVSMIALRGSEWKRFLELIGKGSVPGWYASDERFQDRLRAGLEYADILDSLLAPWLMSHTKEEIFALCRENHIPFAPVRNMDEVVNCEQLNQRKYFAMVECSGIGMFKCPGPPVRFSRSSWNFKQTAFSLGEDNYEVYCKRLSYSREELAQLRRAKIV